MVKRQNILALLLTLVCMCQGWAVNAMPCAAMAGGAAAGSAHDMAGMSHADHQMDSAATHDGTGASCCDGGLCSMSHCQSSVALPPAHPAGSPQYLQSYADSGAPAFPPNPVYTLYRPPISR